MQKKQINFVAGLTAFISIFFSCAQSTSSYSSDSDYSDSLGSDLSQISGIYYNLGSSSSITLSVESGQEILYGVFNSSSSSLPASYQRYCTSYSGITTDTDIYAYSSGSQVSRSACGQSEMDVTCSSSSTIKHFVPPQTFIPQQNSSSRSVTYSDSTEKSTISSTNTFTVDSTTKDIYVDTDVNLSSYDTKSATLRAKNDVCLVWVIDDYYNSSTSSDNEVTSEVASAIAEKFASLYQTEKTVFGDECEYLVSSSGYLQSTSMASSGPTGNYVNIVIYDIGNDYNSASQCGVVGYFYSKDYYVRSSSYSDDRQYSNEGKYFYIDSAYCNYDSSGTFSGVTDSSGNTSVSGTAVTTLFHEFQHMINFNQKNVLAGVSSPTWYNEMLSMLCEDMFASQLDVSDSDAPWGARLPLFNSYYYVSGIDEYLSSNSIYSYSTAYAFGAWLARTYGGPAFVSSMSQNSSTGLESIKEAIEDTCGQSLSSLQLFKKFMQACTYRNDYAEENSLPTFNKSVSSDFTVDGTSVTLTMPAIDIFSEDYTYTDSTFTQEFTGPLLVANGITANIRPHGFLLHYLGQATDSSVTLNFSSQLSDNEEIVVYVQDSFSNTN